MQWMRTTSASPSAASRRPGFSSGRGNCACRCDCTRINSATAVAANWLHSITLCQRITSSTRPPNPSNAWQRPASLRDCCPERSTICGRSSCQRSNTMRSLGIAMAVSSDCNPGTSPLASLLLAMNMACVLFRLTPTEVLLGVTRECCPRTRDWRRSRNAACRNAGGSGGLASASSAAAVRRIRCTSAGRNRRYRQIERKVLTRSGSERHSHAEAEHVHVRLSPQILIARVPELAGIPGAA